MDRQTRPTNTRGSNDRRVPETADNVCACATTRHAARLLTQLYDHFLRPAGIEAPQFALMVAIDEQHRSHQSAIGLRCAMDKTTVSRNLRLLQRKGWITSTRGRDRRKRQVVLTGAGRKRLAAGWPEWRKAQNQLRAFMRGDEWSAMFRTLQAVMKAAQAAHHRLATHRP